MTGVEKMERMLGVSRNGVVYTGPSV
jgi:hypothetical protein